MSTINHLISSIELDLTKMSWDDLKRLQSEIDAASAERTAHLIQTSIAIDAKDAEQLESRVAAEIKRRAAIANAD